MDKQSKIYEGSTVERIDKILPQLYAGKTRSQLQYLIELGLVTIGGRVVKKPSEKITPGEVIAVGEVQEDTEIAEADIPLQVVHEDAAIIVVNKQAGLTVHPGAGNRDNTLVNALVKRYPELKSRGYRPGIVHRLDKDTTGLIVIARDVESEAKLAQQFATRVASRTYLALALSTPRGKGVLASQSSGTIEGNLARSSIDRRKYCVVPSGGKYALTHFVQRELLPWGVVTEIKLATGRTHQIRVHFDHIGSPIIGDSMYGDFSSLPIQLQTYAKNFGRQALHAEKLKIVHPHTQKEIEFYAETPKELSDLIEVFRSFT